MRLFFRGGGGVVGYFRVFDGGIYFLVILEGFVGGND